MSNSISKDFKLFSLLRFALPSMVMMVFMSLYTIIDGIFISRLVGSKALSATNIVYPVINILIAVGIMLASGGSAVIARKLGEKKREEARKDFSMIALVSVLFGAAALVVGNISITPLVKLLGSTPLIQEYCEIYLSILLYFAPACMLQMFFQMFFVTAGKPHIGLTATILGGVVNVVFDYILMGPLHMGIAGAAIATGLGQMIPAVIGVLYFFWVKGDLRFVKPVLDGKVLKESCFNGSSEMVTNFSNAIVTYLFNIIMLDLMGENGVAAITIVLYGQFLFNALYMGFSMGVAPVFSFNYGRRNKILLKRIYKICMLFIIVSSVIITLMALGGSELIVSIFTPKSSETFAIAAGGFFLFSFNYLFAGMNIFASGVFTAFSDGKVSAIISFLRTFGLLVGCIVLLPRMIGENGVWLSVPIAEALTIFVSIWFFWVKRKKYYYAG